MERWRWRRVTEEDPFAGLPEAGEFGKADGDLHLYFDDVYSLGGGGTNRVGAAGRGGGDRRRPAHHQLRWRQLRCCDRAEGLANSRGFVGGYRTSYAGVAAAPLATDANGKMQRDGWWSSARRLQRSSRSPEAVGAEAARRTLRRLGARRVPTQRVPISSLRRQRGRSSARSSRLLLGIRSGAAQRSSQESSARPIASPGVTIVDDNTMLLPAGAGGFGTSPFDGEG